MCWNRLYVGDIPINGFLGLKQFNMTSEQIEKFIGASKDAHHEPAKIFFKTRSTVEGVFIKTPDYMELKRKNFWRIVSVKNLDDYRSSNGCQPLQDVQRRRVYKTVPSRSG